MVSKMEYFMYISMIIQLFHTNSIESIIDIVNSVHILIKPTVYLSLYYSSMNSNSEFYDFINKLKQIELFDLILITDTFKKDREKNTSLGDSLEMLYDQLNK